MPKLVLTAARAEAVGLADGHRYLKGEPLPNPIKRVEQILHAEGISTRANAYTAREIVEAAVYSAAVVLPHAEFAALSYTKGGNYSSI